MRRTVIHRDYTIGYERTAMHTEIMIWYVGNTYADMFDECLSYQAKKDMTLHDICVELLEEIRKFQRKEPDADYYYAEYTEVALDCFINVLKRTIKEEE